MYSWDHRLRITISENYLYLNHSVLCTMKLQVFRHISRTTNFRTWSRSYGCAGAGKNLLKIMAFLLICRANTVVWFLNRSHCRESADCDTTLSSGSMKLDPLARASANSSRYYCWPLQVWFGETRDNLSSTALWVSAEPYSQEILSVQCSCRVLESSCSLLLLNFFKWSRQVIFIDMAQPSPLSIKPLKAQGQPTLSGKSKYTIDKTSGTVTNSKRMQETYVLNNAYLQIIPLQHHAVSAWQGRIELIQPLFDFFFFLFLLSSS